MKKYYSYYVYFFNSIVNRFQIIGNKECYYNFDYYLNVAKFLKSRLKLFKNKYCINNDSIIISTLYDYYKRHFNEKYGKINGCLKQKIKTK